MKKEKNNIIYSPESNSIYQAENGNLALRCDNHKGTIWANLNQIFLLFNRDKSVISKHIKNIFATNELNELETVAFFATVQNEREKNVTREIQYYNLDLILSVGYRIDSKNSTKFRQRATQILHQHITNGWSIDKKYFTTFNLIIIRSMV